MATIQASDYNTLQGTVANILGEGSGSYGSSTVSELFGYGQTVTSSQVASNTEITAAQWAALRNDMLACYYHQGLSLTLPSVPSNTTEITQSDFNNYSAIISAIDADVNRLAFPASGQYSGSVISAPTKSNWSGTVTHTVTVEFTSYTNGSGTVSANDCARYFFNTGGRIEITPSISGGGLSSSDASTSLDIAWQTVFNRVGTIYLNYNSTTCTNTGFTSGLSQTVYVSSGIGFNSLTTSYQTILTSTTASTGTYYPNQYVVNAKVDQTPSPSQITFQILFEDVSTGTNSGSFGIHAVVDSTVTSTVAFSRASGSYVSATAPTAINSSFV
jgi:hypothetical protein